MQELIQVTRNRLKRLIKLVEYEVRDNAACHKLINDKLKEFEMDIYQLTVKIQYMRKDLDNVNNINIHKKLIELQVELKALEKYFSAEIKGIKSTSLIDQMWQSLRYDWKIWIVFLAGMAAIILYLLTNL